jgi:hypothetical protein
LKIPAVCPNGYGKGNHPLSVLFSVIGDALFANLKNLLFIDRLIDSLLTDSLVIGCTLVISPPFLFQEKAG